MVRIWIGEELAAVNAVAARLRLGSIDPVVIKLARHTTIRLDPLPFVARVQSAVTPDQACAGLAKEVSIARYLAVRGLPAVRPIVGIDPGPHIESRCAMTLWEFLPHRKAMIDADTWMVAHALQRFHDAFQSFDGDLPPFTDTIDACRGLLDVHARAPRLTAENRAFLNGLYAYLRASLSGYTYDPAPLHGDPHLGNALLTEAGVVWADLEAACRGPREWDIACLPAAVWSSFDAANPGLVRCLADLRSLCVALWCWADYGRGSEVNEAAAYHLQSLKARFAGRLD